MEQFGAIKFTCASLSFLLLEGALIGPIELFGEPENNQERNRPMEAK